MRSNLAYIDTAAEEALTRQLEAPILPAVVRQKASTTSLNIIAGFAVRDEESEQQETIRNEALKQREINKSRKARRENIESYRRNREDVAVELGKLGITPLAILPKTAWEYLCSKSGLYRLEPTRNGEVRVSDTILKEFENRAHPIARFCLPIFVFSIALLELTCVFLASKETSKVTLAGMTYWNVLVSALVTWALFWDDNSRNPGWKFRAWMKMLIRFQIRRFGKKTHEQVLKTFFPDGTSENGSLSARIILPQPPADVAAILLKAKKLKLKVAAVGEAIAFAETPDQILGREYSRIAEEQDRVLEAIQEERRQALLNDPIIYYEHGMAVAVIAQFGDFPIEQRVVDEVVNSEHLI